MNLKLFVRAILRNESQEECEVSLNLIEQFESRQGAMKVAELTELLGVDDKHIYRMAARGRLPSFRIGGAIRFDPQEIAKWLRCKYGEGIRAGNGTAIGVDGRTKARRNAA